MTKRSLSQFTALMTACLIATGVLATKSQAEWTLDNDASELSFVTIKADHVAEIHTFDTLSGKLSNQGDLRITIDLASVNTLIPIRDERMQAMLFETDRFPRGNVSGQLDLQKLSSLAVGDSTIVSVPFTLDLHGSSQEIAPDLLVTKLANGRLLAGTTKPIIVMADSFGLVEGVQRLREVAGLPSISNAVPVNFTVVFQQDQ
ncbi:MAG: YceI family protein [Pseudohongiellaceae bacterium]